MFERPIADTGCMVSPVGLGTVKFGRNTAVKYPDDFQLPDDKTLSQLLDTASELGINLLDTAPAYGTSEERLGSLLKGTRDRWIISTKVGEQFSADESTYDFSREGVTRSIETSLRRLGTDYLDIVLVHSDGNDRAIITESDSLETLQDLKQQGKIRAVGVSTKTTEGGILALERCDLVMATYNLDHTDDEPVLQLAQALGKGVFIKKALASGHLTGRADADLARALGFVCRHPAVTSVILGTISEEHLRQNVAVIESFY